MHEHKLARDLFPQLEKIARENNLKKVNKVCIGFGMMHMVEPDFMIHSFEHVFEGTIFEGAAVEIKIINPGESIKEGEDIRKARGDEIIIEKLEGS